MFYAMWSTRRVLKKDKKQLNKRRILLLSVFFGFFGIISVGTGILVLSREPAFVSPLPFLKSLSSPSSSKDPGPKQIGQVLDSLKISYKAISKISKTAYEIKLSDGQSVYITINKSIPEQLSSLQRIYSSLTMEGKKFVRLDLRYDKPVIVMQ